MKFLILILSLSILCSSCAVYRQNFDCPADPGVPCTSVTDLEQMIVETDSGPDIFMGSSILTCQVIQVCHKKRIWIPGYRNCDGRWISGHYIEIN